MHGVGLAWTGAWCGCVRCVGGDVPGRDMCMVWGWHGQVHGVAVSGVLGLGWEGQVHGVGLAWTGAWCGCVRCDCVRCVGAGWDRCMVWGWHGQVHGVAVSGVLVGLGLGGTGVSILSGDTNIPAVRGLKHPCHQGTQTSLLSGDTNIPAIRGHKHPCCQGTQTSPLSGDTNIPAVRGHKHPCC